MPRNLPLVFFAAAGALLTSSCVSSLQETAPAIEDSRTFVAPFDTVWSGAVEAVSVLALPIQAIEKDSGILATGPATCNEGRMLEIGTPPNIFLAVWSQGRYSLSIFMRSSATGEVLVRVTPYIEAFEMNLSGKWHQVKSRGTLEREFLDAIERSLGQARPSTL